LSWLASNQLAKWVSAAFTACEDSRRLTIGYGEVLGAFGEVRADLTE